ncbi:MAG: plasmid stabilization protein [Pseudomonadales bacterium]|nr:plasmid stabilization protein [Pseudomonadales bacterium]
MSTTIHYENANFLRELAESLPSITQSKADLLQRLADEELTQAQYDDYLRHKIEHARGQRAAGLHFSNEEVEVEAIRRRVMLQRRAREAAL